MPRKSRNVTFIENLNVIGVICFTKCFAYDSVQFVMWRESDFILDMIINFDLLGAWFGFDRQAYLGFFE